MLNQRWRAGRDSYRPAGETIRPSEYEVAPIVEREAKAFVTTHHYSRSYCAARLRYGLYRKGTLAGVAVFSHPVRDSVLTNVFPTGCAQDSVELGRFVLSDHVPGNGETWFLARCFSFLRRERLVGVVSFSDPLPRTNQAGETVFPGHIGTIYQAASAAYLGRATPRTLHLLPDGSVLSPRALQKIRRQECGHAYAEALLLRQGARPRHPDESGRAWLREVLPRLTRPFRHPGNHRYAWPLQSSAERFLLLARQVYPKRSAA
jgi:hypothetical protein